MTYNLLKKQKKLSSIGQGTMGIGGSFSIEHSMDSSHVAALKLGADLGLTIIDTAEVYAAGHSEVLIGKAVMDMRKKVFIVTKVSPENLAYEDVINACERSLKRLNTEYIDLYMVHWPNPAMPITETMQAMKALKKNGKIHHIGVSNFSLGQLHEAEQALDDEHIDAVQVEYNLFDRTIEKNLLPYCEKNNILVMAYSPLDQGCIPMDGEKASLLRSLAKKYYAKPSEIILAWIISHPCVIAIPKAVNPAHIRSNAKAGNIKLALDDILAISHTFQCKPKEVPVKKIKVVLDGQGSRQAYQTIEQALANKLCFTPSPELLAQDILNRQETIKPIKVRKSTDSSGQFTYDLIEGRIRYWAWVIAFGGEKPIPVLIR